MPKRIHPLMSMVIELILEDRQFAFSPLLASMSLDPQTPASFPSYALERGRELTSELKRKIHCGVMDMWIMSSGSSGRGG